MRIGVKRRLSEVENTVWRKEKVEGSKDYRVE